jgi:uncharacterized SAM-binding protein YcdF (DUF218 family)
MVPRPPAVRQRRPGRRWRFLIAGAALALAALGVATARLFVWPPHGMPARVDAIVMLNGPGNRLDTALKLAWEGRAPVVVVSQSSPFWGHGSICAPKIPGVRVICFDPDPATTRGEAEFAARLAKRYRWRSIALVTTAPQDTRARLRMRRCFAGHVYVVNAPLTTYQWPAEVVYEWAATLKALFLQPGC